ncbi:MAG: hypothetical protein EHM34_10360 [Nitrosopumilales archaeon]|nr:MAG: hypothetical protein EHM34_10360 [Nitrosopumilales archaeon]
MEEEVETFGIKKKDDYIKTKLRIGDPEKEPQAIALLNYLEELGDVATKYVEKYLYFDNIAYLNMKVLSVAILYYNKFGTYKPLDTPEAALDVFLEDKYDGIIYDIFNERGKGQRRVAKTYKNTEALLTEENKLNIRIQVASYLTLLENSG